MKGWHGRLLHIDLTTSTVQQEKIDASLLVEYLGGRGLGGRLFRSYAQADSYSEDMALLFATGPLCGTTAPMTARIAIVSRSPLTGTIFDSSCGGMFAWRLKAAGFDALKVTGKSNTPVVINISSQQAHIEPAPHLWGKTISQTVDALRQKGSVAAIGPAGENQVRYASIHTGEGSVASRGGLGAIMGSKKVKAIVVNGDIPTPVADKSRFDAGVPDVLRLFKASPVLMGDLGFARYGTASLVDLIAQRGMLPVCNFSRTWDAEVINNNAFHLQQAVSIQDKGCFQCPVACKKADYDGSMLPGFDTLNAFGGLNGIFDLQPIIRAHQFCNDYGMDTVSAGSSLAAYGESRGEFISATELVPRLKEIALRKNEGDLLAEGADRLTQALGTPQFSMTVKGLELPSFDPRGAYGLALAYCTSNRGGCHTRAYPLSHEILRKPVATDRFSYAGKARINKNAEDMYATVDSLVACRFAFLAASLEEYGELLSAVTGVDYPAAKLGLIGERIYLTERFYNQQNGFSGQDDALPERFYSTPKSNHNDIHLPPLDPSAMLAELQRYYRLRGLDEHGCLADKKFLEQLP